MVTARVVYVPENGHGILMFPCDSPRNLKRRPWHNRKAWRIFVRAWIKTHRDMPLGLPWWQNNTEGK